MARNYASFYNSTNDSSALEQSIFVKLETTRGQLIAPQATDFLYCLPVSVEYTQAAESSPQRSGRHHTSTIKGKKSLSFTIPMLFNIDTSLGAASSSEIDGAARLLYKSALGYEDVSAGAVYDSRTEPALTFSMWEVGDRWCKQARGCFVDTLTMTFPGDGNAQAEFAGMGSDALTVGIGKSTVNNTANTVTLQTGEGKLFPVGALVMIIEANGTTRSADTPAGSSRTVTSVTGDVVTLSGAPLADADGSSTPIYLCYYEPASKTAIDNPVTGLVGSVVIDSMTQTCVRNATITIANNHEPMDYCYGHDSLHGSMFTAASRMTATVELELNLNQELLKFFNGITAFEAQDIQLVLGDSAGRHLLIDMPKVEFDVPSITVPESGSIPVTFSNGKCLQTALDAADEITVSFI